jgi:hypothetical protein
MGKKYIYKLKKKKKKLYRHKPPVLPDSFFGWIIPLIKISKDEMLHNVGLDAVLVRQLDDVTHKDINSIPLLDASIH